jgi:hypothetical protein
MEYEQRIDRSHGNYIVSTGRDFENILSKLPIKLESGKINPGENTTLHGYFIEPIEFVGFFGKAAIFYLGQGEADLFTDGGFYYDATFIISKNRIGKSYKQGSFRDVFLQQDATGKYFWK